ncbi:MAG: hypothetical protein AB7S26_29680 [Sandaracinaceae bacterium]
MRSALGWNDPKTTWKLASYLPQDDRRAAKDDRREKDARAVSGDRRKAAQRALTSLLRL